METKVTLAPFEQSMVLESADLYIDAFSRAPWNDVYESKEPVIAYFENYRKNNYFLGYVLKLGDEIVALSIGVKKPWMKGMEYYIDLFCVSAKYQGRGFGGKFMRLIEADIQRQGLNAVLLSTTKGVPAERFYLKNGFKELEELVFLAK